MPVPPIPTHLFSYPLTDDKIAIHPLAKRDESKLLMYNNGNISDHRFFELPRLFPTNFNLVFNNTKVISARMKFRRSTGATIEIFLLEPELPTTVVSLAMIQTKSCAWRCLVGNIKKWNPDETLILENNGLRLEARLVETGKQPLVAFAWTPAETPFYQVIEALGLVPLPPYIKRDAELEDKATYQTVYAKNEGAVAAPTAGLHFTAEVLSKLEKSGHGMLETTLHVSAGTFLPLKAETADEHDMHVEQLSFSKRLIAHLAADNREVIAVGTTSMRALESLYWYSVKLLQDPDSAFYIDKDFAYDCTTEKHLPAKTVFAHMLNWMDSRGLDEVMGATQIFIVPGYDFKVCKGLITNFHQPDSTLLMLVAALVGDDWQKIYTHALSHEYRFLSYGDSSLLFRNRS